FNVALIMGLASAFLRLLPLSPRARRFLLTICVLLYWDLVSASGSIARAALMSLLCLAGAALGRPVQGRHAIGTACILILGSNPYWILDPCFPLSVAATLGLLPLIPPGAHTSTAAAPHHRDATT